MNKISKQQFKNKNCNAKDFVSLEQIFSLQYTIFPKLLKSFSDKYKKLWEDKINSFLPKNNLNFNSEKDYLDSNKITKEDVIISSIRYSLPNLEEDDLKYLSSYFSIFSNHSKIKILTKDKKNTPIYIEIINVLSYISNIEKLIDKYPKSDGNHLGTKHRSSSYKSLLETQLNILENRLDGRFFTLENEDEIKKTKIQVKFISYALKEEFKDLPEWMNYTNINLGFDNNNFEMNDIEIKAFTQLCSFFNGIKTSKEEILNSVMIYTRTQSNIKNENLTYHKQLSESIINILRFFFNKTILEIQQNRKKKTIVYKEENVLKDYHIKTYISEIPIYSYNYKNSNDSLNELMQLGVNSILGLQTIFDEDTNLKEEPSEFQQIKNILKIRKAFNLTKKEFKTFLFFIEKSLNQ